MTNTITDNVSALRIRIPVIPQEEEEYTTPVMYAGDDDFTPDYESEYDPFDDLENHYACLEYFEALRRAREQLHPDYQQEEHDISPIYGSDSDTPTVWDSL